MQLPCMFEETCMSQYCEYSVVCMSHATCIENIQNPCMSCACYIHTTCKHAGIWDAFPLGYVARLVTATSLTYIIACTNLVNVQVMQHLVQYILSYPNLNYLKEKKNLSHPQVSNLWSPVQLATLTITPY